MILVFFGFLSLKLWQQIPEQGIIYPFKFNPDQGIDSHTYHWLMCIWFCILCISFAVLFFADQCRLFFHVVFISVAAEFAEYYFRYNTHWAEVFGYPVTVSTLRSVALTGVMFYYLYTIVKSWIQSRGKI